MSIVNQSVCPDSDRFLASAYSPDGKSNECLMSESGAVSSS